MHNVFKRFDGDIIITDPCYIIATEGKVSMEGCPAWWDFVTKQKKVVKDGQVFHFPPEPEDYPDCRNKQVEDYVGESDTFARVSVLLKS